MSAKAETEIRMVPTASKIRRERESAKKVHPVPSSGLQGRRPSPAVVRALTTQPPTMAVRMPMIGSLGPRMGDRMACVAVYPANTTPT